MIKTQAEIIADIYEGVANMYSPLNDNDVQLPQTQQNKTIIVSEKTVLNHLLAVKVNTTTVLNDIPAKLIKRMAKYLSGPLTHIINTMIKLGQFPDTWKIEQVTPIPKIYPTLEVKQLWKISVFKHLGKIAEKVIVDMVIEDLTITLDKLQYGIRKISL